MPAAFHVLMVEIIHRHLNLFPKAVQFLDAQLFQRDWISQPTGSKCRVRCQTMRREEAWITDRDGCAVRSLRSSQKPAYMGSGEHPGDVVAEEGGVLLDIVQMPHQDVGQRHEPNQPPVLLYRKVIETLLGKQCFRLVQ